MLLIGGGIGARVTGVVARVLMDVWADRLATCLESNDIGMWMLAKYVDDINTVLSIIPKGNRWKKDPDFARWRLEWSEESLAKDIAEGKTDSLRTIELVKEIGDCLVPGLRLTFDLPELHPSGKCPMLDIQVWVEDREECSLVRHTFFQKPVTSPLVFHAAGAHNWKSKIITLSEELRRRYLHMDGRHSIGERQEIVRDFLQKMADSGYSHEARREVIASATKKFCRQLMNQMAGG